MRWRYVVAAALALVASTSLARKVYVRVAGRGRALVIQADINQRVSGPFILDTGASYCVVSKETADAANLSGRKDGPKVKLSTASGVVEARLAEARRIDVGDAVARDVEVAVVEKDVFPGFRGLIGLSFLRHFKYSVDSGEGTLLLEN